MDTAPAPENWPALLTFLREWVFLPAIAVIGLLWNEIRRVKQSQKDQLDRIERSLLGFASSLQAHEVDDLKRYASKEDLSILRNDVVELKRHIDERFDRLTELVSHNSR